MPSFDILCNQACMYFVFKMVKKLSEDLRWRVIYHRFIYGSSIEETARSLFVSKRFVSKIRALYERTKDVKPTSSRRRGRPRMLSYRDNRLIRSMVITKAELYIDEYVDWFRDVTGRVISLATMCRTIIRLGFTYKKMKIIAYQRRETDRANYARFIAPIPRHMLLFIDETGKDISKLQRKMGRSPRGSILANIGYFVREEKYSCVSAMNIEGVVASHTIPNAFSTGDFNFALRHFILPHVGRFALGEPNSVVVMDNARIHDSNECIRMIRERGGIVVFLPPYSPDLSPIEEAFGTAKSWLKRHRDVAQQSPKYCIALALNQITPDQAEAFFVNCGYLQ
ncbi:uncharacterized protein LOC144640731 isoform X1 [Oculina patagonica]